MVHQVQVGILVKFLGGLTQLASREEIDWALLISHLDKFVIANYVTCLCQFEDVLIGTYGTNHLASSNVLNAFSVSDRRSLDLFRNALLTDAVTAKEHSRQIPCDAFLRV